jgi:cytoskeletal protein CcmA (bactofilin family)
VRKVPRLILSFLLLLGIIMLPVGGLMAAAADQVVVVTADQTREGSTFLAGDEVRIEGTINGDLYVAAETITVNGSVNGDIIGAARNLIVSGTVQGDVRALGQTIRLKGPITGSATLVCDSLYLEREAAIAGDLVAGCSTINLDGSIDGSVFSWSENFFLNGSVAKNVDMYVRMLNVTDGASIGGNLTYVSDEEGYISENAQIGGRRIWKPETTETSVTHESPWSMGGFLVSLAGILIIYALFKKMRPQFWDSLTQPARERVLSAAGIGLLLLFAAPILAVLAMITVIGIPLGIIALITYGLLLYVSKLVVSLYLADLLRVRYDMQQSWLWFAVLVLLMLVVHLPYVGWIISVAVFALGLGCGFYALFGNNDTKGDVTDTVL